MVGGNLTIEALPDEVLLQVFSLCKPRGHVDHFTPPETWEWHILPHVCQRWRRLVFAFPRYLGLVLVTGRRRRVRGALDCWPALPIAIQHRTRKELSPKDVDDVLSGLKHPDRIYEIDLPLSDCILEKSATLAWSFPELERLDIRSAHIGHGKKYQVPHGFLGGSTPTSHKLRHIELLKITFPSLPQLLLSNNNLVSLFLGRDVLIGEEYIPSNTLASSLSAATQLEYLHVEQTSTISNLKQRTTHPQPLSPNLFLLPSLVEIGFHGSNEYLEDLVSRIHAPIFHRIRVGIFQEGAQPLDLSKLCQFLSWSECLQSLPLQTSISIHENGFEIVHDFGAPPRGPISVNVCFYGRESWDMSRVVHVSRQLCPLTSGVERLIIQTRGVPPSLRDESATMRWLQLFMPFNGAREVQVWVCNNDQSDDGIVNALHESTEMGQEVFPALRILRLRGFGTKTPQGIKSFVNERRRSRETVTVLRSRRYGSESDVESVF